MSTQKKRVEKENIGETYGKDKKIIYKLIIKIILLAVLTFPTVFLLRASLTANSILTYTEKGTKDYKDNLKENNFYNDNFLGQNMTYITSLVDYIDIDMNYNFKSSEKANFDYTYSIYANLVITPEDNSKVLFDEKYILVDNISKQTTNADNYNINKTINLDYNYYNDLANTFKTTYGVNCNSKLVVSMKVNTNGKDLEYERDFNTSNQMKVTLSLAKKQVDIDMNSAKIDEVQNITVSTKGLIKNKGLFMIGMIFTFAVVLASISTYKTANGIRLQKDDYTRYIEKILNNYDRAIVETRYMPNLDDYEEIEVSKFSELIDVRDTLRLPILYTPIEGEGSCFYIRHEHTVYIHYVSCTSLVPVNKKSDSWFM